MRRLLLHGCLCGLTILSAACTTASAPDSSPPAQMLLGSVGAAAYGGTTSEVIQNPELREKLPALFGADWTPASPARGQVAEGAAAFFEKGGPPQMVRVAGADYVARPAGASSTEREAKGEILITPAPPKSAVLIFEVTAFEERRFPWQAAERLIA